MMLLFTGLNQLTITVIFGMTCVHPLETVGVKHCVFQKMHLPTLLSQVQNLIKLVILSQDLSAVKKHVLVVGQVGQSC